MKKKLIELLFDEYAKSLNVADPKFKDMFVCPICMRPFHKEDINNKAISIEHIPPKAIGSSIKTMTCTKCNNDVGTKLQAHMNNYVRKKDLLAGRILKPIPAKVKIDGRIFDTRITDNKGAGRWTGVSVKNQLPPDMWPEDAEKFVGKQAVVSLGIPTPKEIVDAAYLHSAYLALFSLFGYPYIMQPFLNPIRKKINDCSVKEGIAHRLLILKLLAPKFYLDPRDPRVGIALIWKNIDISCLGVIIAGEIVLMPFISEYYKLIYSEFSTYMSNVEKGIKVPFPFGIAPLEIDPTSKYHTGYTFEGGKELDGLKSLRLVPLQEV